MTLNSQIAHINDLIALKRRQSSLHNEIHNALAAIANEKFKQKYPSPPYEYTIPNAGRRGIDITITDQNRNPVLMAELKGSLVTSKKGRLNGQQYKAIRNDLLRLRKQDNSIKKVLVILDETTRKEILRLTEDLREFREIMVFNPLHEDYAPH